MANLNVPINANVIDPNIQLPGPSNPLILPIDFTSSTLYFNDPNEKIIEFLKHDYEGLVVLSTFEFKSEKCLTDDARNLLVKKVDRPIESSRFQLLADEIGETFNEEPGIYFTPFTHEGNIKINANGKLWDRYNYVKKVLRNAGILKPIVNTPVQPETPLVTVELSDGDVVEKLEFLKTNLEPWDVITQYWNETYIARKNTLKNNELSPISIHRCLHQQSGILLIHDDFKQLFSNKLNAVSTRWDFLEQFIEQYAKIDSQLADNSEAKNLIAALSSLTGHNKQVALLLLLGFMLKPTNIKPLTPKNSKKEN